MADNNAKTTIYKLKYTLLGTEEYLDFLREYGEVKEGIIRTDVLLADTDLKEVHINIQGSFGWSDEHEHEFCKLDDKAADDKDGKPLYAQPNTKLEDSTKIGDVFSSNGDSIIYHYDFGDDWLVRVELVGTITLDLDVSKKQLNRLLLGIDCAVQEVDGEGVMEDVGGVAGYVEFLKAVYNLDNNSPFGSRKEALKWAEEIDKKACEKLKDM